MFRHTAPRLPTSSEPDAQHFPARDAAAHDMANLVHAASRSAAAARRTGNAEDHLPALEAAIAQMGDLLAVLFPPPRTRFPSDAGLSVRDAILHAAQFMRPAAAELHVTIHAEASDALRSLAAPGLFRALTDCLRNSLESIAGSGTPGSRGGAIVVLAHAVAGELRISIADDGAGFPMSVPDPFAPGASSKPASSGLGLAVVRHVVGRLHGTASIEPAAGTHAFRPGALVRIAIPVQSLTQIARTPHP
jgi:signal transduction histidine kinase